MLQDFRGSRNFSGDRSYQKKGDFSRQVRQARKDHTPGTKENGYLNLAVFASFARDIPVFGCGIPARNLSWLNLLPRECHLDSARWKLFHSET
jgi:hypothetical protein